MIPLCSLRYTIISLGVLVCRGEGISFVRLDGSTSAKKRARVMQEFASRESGLLQLLPSAFLDMKHTGMIARPCLGHLQLRMYLL